MFALAFALALLADIERREIGPLRIEVQRPARAVGLDDLFQIQITLQYPPHVSVQRPSLRVGQTLDSALVTEMRVDGPDAIDGQFGRFLVQNWTLTLEPTKVGRLALEKLPLQFQEKGKPLASAALLLPTLDVMPGRFNASPNDELKLPPPLPTDKRSHLARWMKVVGGIALAAFPIALMVNAVRQVSKVEDGRSAIESARGTPRQAISQICDAVRGELHLRHGISAAHLTTPELLADEERLASLPMDKRAALAELLPLADLLRFPRPEPTALDLERCRRIALRFVETQG